MPDLKFDMGRYEPGDSHIGDQDLNALADALIRQISGGDGIVVRKYGNRITISLDPEGTGRAKAAPPPPLPSTSLVSREMSQEGNSTFYRVKSSGVTSFTLDTEHTGLYMGAVIITWDPTTHRLTTTPQNYQAGEVLTYYDSGAGQQGTLKVVQRLSPTLLQYDPAYQGTQFTDPRAGGYLWRDTGDVILGIAPSGKTGREPTDGPGGIVLTTGQHLGSSKSFDDAVVGSSYKTWPATEVIGSVHVSHPFSVIGSSYGFVGRVFDVFQQPYFGGFTTTIVIGGGYISGLPDTNHHMHVGQQGILIDAPMRDIGNFDITTAGDGLSLRSGRIRMDSSPSGSTGPVTSCLYTANGFIIYVLPASITPATAKMGCSVRNVFWGGLTYRAIALDLNGFSLGGTIFIDDSGIHLPVGMKIYTEALEGTTPGHPGASGTFLSANTPQKTITVEDGQIISIV